ncbi:beta-glucan synthesis-associated protein [Dichomitus squalens]|uniref:beta-glucan synthesis-associated protein n=1 Tax=Dichomitus squalens (strain LYAD-421) TaxID=732165 RepID=UPI0004413FA2|nr:beta-glucan synthesis-associated protein [Dichomitus squalens LYAD-421 SS1]EJF66803.1 beta-glucan synthesis-associated protein [Dichomitus squalens LYAD-421 SS1]TBU49858.1 beta-glucan synthesis-associated protein [Dichomitus squalens]
MDRQAPGPQKRLYPSSAAPSTTSLLQPHGHDEVRPPLARSLRASTSNSSINTASTHVPPSISDRYVLPLDPAAFDGPEADDKLHNPDPVRDHRQDKGGTIITSRGLMNLGCIFVLVAGIVALFAGYPLIEYFTKKKPSTLGGFNLGGINASGQIPSIPGNWGMIDLDTPHEVRTKVDYVNGKTWQLVFSDEFNVEGRTFYPGDDPYWEAVDLHYWQTNNKEWYDPEAIVTRNGSLEITLSRKENHGLNFTGGMMSTWNKFCFTGGLVEASVMLPGFNDVAGLWPAIWAMGNLGRAGYGASLDGMWPYTYDECDVGTAPNQTLNGLPLAATAEGDNDKSNDGVLSFLPGQRLSRCTCPGESHPGPIHRDTGEYVGRAAPEIDMFEAQISDNKGAVSQSGQWAPFNYQYIWKNTTDNLIIPDPDISKLNNYRGGVYQQATSVVTQTNQDAYEFSGQQYSTYGFQYKPGFGDAYISWIANGQLAWQLNVAGMSADTVVEISDRPIPQEPMYLIMNLGISENFGFVDYDHLQFPSTLRVDWIRVYQDPKNINIGCDPPDFPTAAYINEYIEAYTNPDLTTWVDDYKQAIPKSKLLGQC